jgi:hexosaminidase
MAKAGNDVILAIANNCYFDWYQSTCPNEPKAMGGVVTLKNAYSLKSKLSKLTTKQQKHILGAEACLWTEFVKTDKHAEYMTFPRICALAEVVWTPANKRNWGDFENRIAAHYERFDRLGVNYRRY